MCISHASHLSLFLKHWNLPSCFSSSQHVHLPSHGRRRTRRNSKESSGQSSGNTRALFYTELRKYMLELKQHWVSGGWRKRKFHSKSTAQIMENCIYFNYPLIESTFWTKPKCVGLELWNAYWLNIPYFQSHSQQQKSHCGIRASILSQILMCSLWAMAIKEFIKQQQQQHESRDHDNLNL